MGPDSPDGHCLSHPLLHPVLPGTLTVSRFTGGMHPAAFSGQKLQLQASPLAVAYSTFERGNLLVTDLASRNGVLHLVSKVLMPAFNPQP